MLDLLISFIAKIVSECLQAVVELIMPLLDFDFDTFVNAFPYAAQSFPIFQNISMAITLLLAAIGLVFMRSPQSKTTPIRTAGHVIMAIFGIYFGNYLLTGIMDIAQMPYYALMNEDAVSWSTWNFGAVTNLIADVCYQSSILLYILVLLLVGIAFIKLLLEAVERYAMVFFLIFVSPLAASTLATEETSGVCKRFITMFISQCLLMILNIWSLKMVISMFSGLSASAMPLLNLLIGYAFLRIASKIDSLLNQLGLSAAVTGVGLGSELMAAGMALAGMVGNGRGGKPSESSGETGGILGLAQKAATGFGKISPLSGAGKVAGNTIGAAAKTVSSGFEAGKAAAAGASGSFAAKALAGWQAATQDLQSTGSRNFQKGLTNAQNASLWVRGAAHAIGGAGGAGIDAEVFTAAQPLTPEQHEDVANNAFLAARGFNAFTDDSITNESSDIASIMQGTGIEAADPSAAEVIDVGYGNIDADQMGYQLDGNGIEASFTRDGKTETWSIKNATQYSRLSPEEQHAYTPYKDASGNLYYYRHGSVRAPSETVAEKQAAADAVKAWGASPATTKLSGDNFTAMRKNPAIAHSVYSALAENHSAIRFKTSGNELKDAEHIPALRNIAGHLEAMNLTDINSHTKSAAVMHLRSGEVESAAMSENGTQVEWTDAENLNRLTVLTECGARSNDLVTNTGSIDESYLANAGYAHTNLGGQDLWAKVDKIPIDKSKNHSPRNDKEII